MSMRVWEKVRQNIAHGLLYPIRVHFWLDNLKKEKKQMEWNKKRKYNYTVKVALLV